MKLTLHPDSIFEKWGHDISGTILEKGPYCLLDKVNRQDLVEKILEESLYGALLETDFAQKSDPNNGLERRARAAGHIKIILESLDRDNGEYDTQFIGLGIDMIEVWKHYKQRKENNSYYKTGIVTERKL